MRGITTRLRTLAAPASLAAAQEISGLGRTTPALLRTRNMSASVQGLAAFVIYATAWVVHYVPALVLHPGLPQLDQTSMDPNSFVWNLEWWPYALTHGVDPLVTNIIGAPAGFNLSWLTTVPAIALIGAPITAIFGPIVTFNLLTVAAPPVAAWAAFVLCRRLTGRFLVARAAWSTGSRRSRWTTPSRGT